MMGPWTFGANWDKRGNWSEMKDPNLNGATAIGEGSLQSTNSGLRTLNELGGTDNDHDVYQIYGIYRWATGQAGLRFELDRNATDGALAVTEWVSTYHELAPYLQWVSGPFSIEAEFRYIWGKQDFDGTTTDIDRRGWSLYLNPKYSMGAFYGGLEFAYITGNDPATSDKNEAGVSGGQAWDPLLMYGNYWFSKHQAILGQVRDKTGAYVVDNPINATGGSETNLIMFKPYVGWKVNPQLEVVAQWAWLKADEVESGWDDEYGKEFDIYATYKLYNNLTYTVGFGYFWTGDYFKQGPANLNVDDNWLLMNALNFTF